MIVPGWNALTVIPSAATSRATPVEVSGPGCSFNPFAYGLLQPRAVRAS